MESAKAVVCPAHECNMIWERSNRTAACNHLSSCDSLARCAAAPLGQSIALVFLPVHDMLQFSGALVVQHCSDKIDGRWPCTICEYLVLQGTLNALGFWNMVCGKYNTHE